LQKAKLKLNDQTYVRMHKASSGSTVVEHSTADPEIKGLNPVAAEHQQKNDREFFLIKLVHPFQNFRIHAHLK
jgi:hypothetical protein